MERKHRACAETLVLTHFLLSDATWFWTVHTRASVRVILKHGFCENPDFAGFVPGGVSDAENSAWDWVAFDEHLSVSE